MRKRLIPKATFMIFLMVFMSFHVSFVMAQDEPIVTFEPTDYTYDELHAQLSELEVTVAGEKSNLAKEVLEKLITKDNYDTIGKSLAIDTFKESGKADISLFTMELKDGTTFSADTNLLLKYMQEDNTFTFKPKPSLTKLITGESRETMLDLGGGQRFSFSQADEKEGSPSILLSTFGSEDTPTLRLKGNYGNHIVKTSRQPTGGTTKLLKETFENDVNVYLNPKTGDLNRVWFRPTENDESSRMYTRELDKTSIVEFYPQDFTEGATLYFTNKKSSGDRIPEGKGKDESQGVMYYEEDIGKGGSFRGEGKYGYTVNLYDATKKNFREQFRIEQESGTLEIPFDMKRFLTSPATAKEEGHIDLDLAQAKFEGTIDYGSLRFVLEGEGTKPGQLVTQLKTGWLDPTEEDKIKPFSINVLTSEGKEEVLTTNGIKSSIGGVTYHPPKTTLTSKEAKKQQELEAAIERLQRDVRYEPNDETRAELTAAQEELAALKATVVARDLKASQEKRIQEIQEQIAAGTIDSEEGLRAIAIIESESAEPRNPQPGDPDFIGPLTVEQQLEKLEKEWLPLKESMTRNPNPGEAQIQRERELRQQMVALEQQLAQSQATQAARERTQQIDTQIQALKQRKAQLELELQKVIDQYADPDNPTPRAAYLQQRRAVEQQIRSIDQQIRDLEREKNKLQAAATPPSTGGLSTAAWLGIAGGAAALIAALILFTGDDDKEKE